jgi:DNA-binding NtrC family response regulator
MSFDKLDSLLGLRSQKEQKSAVERAPVLIIDDDAGIRAALTALLSDLYDVIVCASANEGVAAMHGEVCAVILDVKMQVHDGFWACDRIRERWPEIPVIFYSAYQDAKDPYRIINEHRPFAYLPKGSDETRLIKTLEHAVRLYSIALKSRKMMESFQQKGQPKADQSAP